MESWQNMEKKKKKRKGHFFGLFKTSCLVFGLFKMLKIDFMKSIGMRHIMICQSQTNAYDEDTFKKLFE
jgi:hypothetical protein